MPDWLWTEKKTTIFNLNFWLFYIGAHTENLVRVYGSKSKKMVVI